MAKVGICARHGIPILPCRLRVGPGRKVGCWKCEKHTPKGLARQERYKRTAKSRARYGRYNVSEKGKINMRKQYRTPKKRERQKWWFKSKYRRLRIEENKI